MTNCWMSSGLISRNHVDYSDRTADVGDEVSQFDEECGAKSPALRICKSRLRKFAPGDPPERLKLTGFLGLNVEMSNVQT